MAEDITSSRDRYRTRSWSLKYMSQVSPYSFNIHWEVRIRLNRALGFCIIILSVSLTAAQSGWACKASSHLRCRSIYLESMFWRYEDGFVDYTPKEIEFSDPWVILLWDADYHWQTGIFEQNFVRVKALKRWRQSVMDFRQLLLVHSDLGRLCVHRCPIKPSQ